MRAAGLLVLLGRPGDSWQGEAWSALQAEAEASESRDADADWGPQGLRTATVGRQRDGLVVGCARQGRGEGRGKTSARMTDVRTGGQDVKKGAESTVFQAGGLMDGQEPHVSLAVLCISRRPSWGGVCDRDRLGRHTAVWVPTHRAPARPAYLAVLKGAPTPEAAGRRDARETSTGLCRAVGTSIAALLRQ